MYLHLVKKKTWVASFLLLLVLVSCSLSPDQEGRLNSALQEYVEARNEGKVRLYVGLTHPEAVRFYKNKGAEEFTKHFSLAASTKRYYLRDGSQVEVKSSGKTIHVKYDFQAYYQTEGGYTTRKKAIYAISPDEGQKWKFLEETDYKNVDIFPSKERLIP